MMINHLQQKKGKHSVFEYKEIISGLKERITDTKEKITDTISKKFEEFSGDSSSSPSPDKETVQTIGRMEIIPESAAVLRAEAPVPNDDQSTEGVDLDAAYHPLQDHFVECDDDDTQEQEEIEVVDEYFTLEPVEDFTGSPGFSVNAGSQPRSRSKLKRLINKSSKSSATVSMSKLISTTSSPTEEKTGLESLGMEDNHAAASVGEDEKLGMENIKGGNIKPTEKNVSLQRLVAVAVCVFAYLIIPLPSYFSGLVMGLMLASASWAFYFWLTQPPKPEEPFKLTPLEELPPMELPEMKEPVKDDGIYKGWMNELNEYNPDDYHINQTHSVYARLEGVHLRLQRPKISVPKRAMWDEMIPHTSFIHQRHFELPGSRVFLLPPGLVKKRIWSKKYPICIALAELGTKSSTADAAGASKSTTPTAENDMGFEIISEEKCDNSILYLFARTGREKEDWFKRLQAASMGNPLGNHLLELKRTLSNQQSTKHARSSSDLSLKHKRQGSTDSTSSTSSLTEVAENPHPLQGVDLQGFARYMGRLMPGQGNSRVTSPMHTKKDPKDDRDMTWMTQQISGSLICDKQLFWINALVGRCFWDFLRDQWWANKVTEKLQRKLSKIHVPYFIEELQVTHIDIGSEMPAIRRAGRPYLDENGFWVDLDLAYSGGFKMTIETKINLMKLKKTSHTVSSQRSMDVRSPVTDSDEEDSAESSTDEEEESTAAEENTSSGGTASKKFLRYLDKITQSKYFQQATEYKYIKKAMEGVSNTPLVLNVEVKNLIGTLSVNIPPPPTDRLWYGFRGNPRLWLSAKPKVGEREVTITHVTDWIEKKLSVEFQRVFVMPNMDDLVIPILSPGFSAEAIPTMPKSSSTSV